MDLECHDPPAYYSIVLHILALIAFPINSFGCYLVIAKSPRTNKYKYCQLYLQIVTFIVEIYMSWIGAGYYYTPMMGGFNTSIIANALISTHTSLVYFFFTFCFELPAMFTCFQYRADAAADLDPRKRIPRGLTHVNYFLAHIFPFLIATLLLFSDTTKEEQYRIVSTYFPKCLHLLSRPEFAVYDYQTNPCLKTAGLLGILWVFYFSGHYTVLVYRTVSILQKMRPHMSPATFKLHKTALISLSLQVLIPFGLLLIPLSIMFTVVLKQLTKWQEFATDQIFLISCHSMVSTIVMICCNGRYLDVIRSFFTDTLKMKRLQLQNISIVERTTTVVAIR